MDVVNFLKEKERLCDKMYYGTTGICSECPLQYKGCDMNEPKDDIEEVIKIVQQWSQTHPQKTMMQDFFEKFPNAPKDEKEGGVPKLVCPKQLGYTNRNEDCTELFDCDCLKCWSRPLEE